MRYLCPIPKRRGLGEAAQVILAIRARHLGATHGRLPVVIEERPHHRAHRVVDGVGGVGRVVRFGAAGVETGLGA